MSRRFYLKPQVRKPATRMHSKASYPFWFIPALIGIGAILAIGLFWLISDDEPAPKLAESKSATMDPAVKDTSSVSPVQKETPRQVPVSAPLVSMSGLRVQVLNGCGVKGLARRVSPALRGLGLDVRETKNASRPDYDYSSIIDRRGNVDAARALADSLGIKREHVSSEFAPNLVDIDLTLIVGADYRRLNLKYQAAKEE